MEDRLKIKDGVVIGAKNLKGRNKKSIRGKYFFRLHPLLFVDSLFVWNCFIAEVASLNPHFYRDRFFPKERN